MFPTKDGSHGLGQRDLLQLDINRCSAGSLLLLSRGDLFCFRAHSPPRAWIDPWIGKASRIRARVRPRSPGSPSLSLSLSLSLTFSSYLMASLSFRHILYKS